MIRRLTVALSVVVALLVFAPVAVAMPKNECARMCSDRRDYKSCVVECLKR
jgi:hypothetical protein